MRTPLEIETSFGDTTQLSETGSFYLVGIGGAGMSALAWMLQHRRIRVRGSDSTASPLTDQLYDAGIQVDIGHANSSVGPGDQVVLSDAIRLDDSPEVSQARKHGLPVFRRSQLLGWLLRGKKVIAVTGTHGKTTTTSMIGAGLRAANLDPTIVVGAYVPEFGASVLEGVSEWAVVEACEAYDSFHDLSPHVVVLTNLELDHIDFHRTWDHLRDSVARFVGKIPSDGSLIYCADDLGAAEIASRFHGNKVGYDSVGLEELILNAPGEHNRRNATGALEAIRITGANVDEAKRGIEAFGGAERRLQLLAEQPIAVVDDYAHHPTEISASISALRERFPNRRLIVVYQPHLYSRTADLIPEFARELSHADVVVLTDIYPAREEPIPGVSSARIAELVTAPCRYVPSRHLLPREVSRIVREGDVVVGMGAGTIGEFAREFIDEIKRPTVDQARNGRKLRICVLYGGDSAEREVSILSGRAVANALRNRGHETELVDLSESILSGKDLPKWTGANRTDAVFLAVHGTHAEDGAIQGLLELWGLPYTGSGIQSSAIAMDKSLSKAILANRGIRVPKGELISVGTCVEAAIALLEANDLGSRSIVKPNAQGSTVGLSFVERSEDLPDALARAHAYGDALVEEWVEGMEISVPVLGDRALNPVEIAPASGKYDFESKYTPGATEEIVPARMPQSKLEEAMAMAMECHKALGCAGATRIDMIVAERGLGEIVVLEINTLPGMTSTSLLPNSASSMGISMEDLCEWMVFDAMERSAQRP